MRYPLGVISKPNVKLWQFLGRTFLLVDRLSENTNLQDGKLLHQNEPPQNQNFVRRLLPGRERVVCLRESDGEVLWTHEYDCPYTTVALYAIGPRCTPTVDGQFVYTLGAEGRLLCLRVSDGSVVWSRDFKDDYGLKIPDWGVAAHPLIDGNRLICVVGGNGSTCVAFDKNTGRRIWRALSAKEPGYCPPVIHEIAGERQLIKRYRAITVARCSTTALLVGLLATSQGGLRADGYGETWPQWRGPNRDGSVSGDPWPNSLQGQHLGQLWRIELPLSYSGPVVSIDKVFVTFTRDKKYEGVHRGERGAVRPAVESRG